MFKYCRSNITSLKSINNSGVVGVVTVHGSLTRDTPMYNLTVRAQEVMSGLSATAILIINIQVTFDILLIDFFSTLVKVS